MSSDPSPTTGIREKPDRMNRFIAWRAVRSWSIVTMVVRGTMTSLACVSPSSKTEWIMSRSSSSMTAWSPAKSTSPRSSDSVRKGP